MKSHRDSQSKSVSMIKANDSIKDIYTIGENLTKNFVVVTELGTNERTNERKDKNYIPLGINAGGILKLLESFFVSHHLIQTGNCKIPCYFRKHSFFPDTT